MGKIGDMSRKVEITNPVNTKSAMGAPKKSFAHFAWLWTSRKAVGDNPEGFVNERLVYAPRYKYKSHYFFGINETMRLVDDGITYNILSADMDPDDKLFIEILVERVVE